MDDFFQQLDSAPEARLITNLVLLVCTSNLVFPQPGDDGPDGSNWTAMPMLLSMGIQQHAQNERSNNNCCFFPRFE